MVAVYRRHKIWVWLLCVAIGFWSTSLSTQLYRHAQQPVDAILVLGGSIRRELAVAEMVSQGSSLPVLISHGSQPPCARILFDQLQANTDNVWLETCAESTFDNYRYSLPTLKTWKAQHVLVVTSPTHLPRAKWLAQILLSSHGIWVDMQLVDEIGIPANRETPLKTVLDVMRSLGWAIVSQVYQPKCSKIMSLSSVDLSLWSQQGFTCEHQADIQIKLPE